MNDSLVVQARLSGDEARMWTALMADGNHKTMRDLLEDLVRDAHARAFPPPIPEDAIMGWDSFIASTPLTCAYTHDPIARGEKAWHSVMAGKADPIIISDRAMQEEWEEGDRP